MNMAHDDGKGSAIRIKGYTKEERLGQDSLRGKDSRVKKTPGSWEWILRFRQHADRRHGALALLMFTTGARISQAIAMHPKHHLDLQNCQVIIPAAKGHDARRVTISKELVADLANLPVLYPRGWPRKPDNARVFGFADRSSPRKGWDAACKAAGIERLPFHAAGRHGFGQEMNVRQPVDEKSAGQVGGWSDTTLMKRVYTHAEKAEQKVLKAQARGPRKAEKATKLKLKRVVG
jgi:integrase